MLKLNKKCFGFLIGLFIFLGALFSVFISKPTKVYALLSDTEVSEPDIILADGKVGMSYEQAIVFDEFEDGYTYEIKYMLLYGLTFSESGVISGIPLEYGQVYFWVTLRDADDYPVLRKSCSLKVVSNDEWAYSESWKESESYADIENGSATNLDINFFNYCKQYNKLGQILYSSEERMGRTNINEYFYNEDDLLNVNISSIYQNKYFKSSCSVQTLTYDDQNRQLKEVQQNYSESNISTRICDWTYSENVKRAEYTITYKNLISDIERVEARVITYTTIDDTITTETIMYSDNKITKIYVSRSIETPTMVETEVWIVYESGVQHRKNINTISTTSQARTAINIIYEDGWEDSKTDNVVEVDRKKTITESDIIDSKEIYITKEYDKDENLIETRKNIYSYSISNNNSSLYVVEIYKEDVFVSKTIGVQEFDKCLFNNKEALLYLVNNYDKNNLQNHKLKANTGVDIVLDKNLIVPEGMSIEFNNVKLSKDKKIVLNDASSVKILGDLMSGEKVVKSNVAYENEAEIYSEKSYNPLALIIVGCCILLVIGGYVAGLIIYRKKNLNNKLMKILYHYIKK